MRARVWSLAVTLGLAVLTDGAARTSVAQAQNGAWSSLPSGAAPTARREYAAIYDESNQRYLIFSGLHGDWSGGFFLLSEAWVLTLGPTPAWSHLAIPGATPGERAQPEWGYDPARNRLLIFGGYVSHYTGDPLEYLSDVWQLSLDGTPAWTELFPTGTPPAGRLAGGAV